MSLQHISYTGKGLSPLFVLNHRLLKLRIHQSQQFFLSIFLQAICVCSLACYLERFFSGVSSACRATIVEFGVFEFCSGETDCGSFGAQDRGADEGVACVFEAEEFCIEVRGEFVGQAEVRNDRSGGGGGIGR